MKILNSLNYTLYIGIVLLFGFLLFGKINAQDGYTVYPIPMGSSSFSYGADPYPEAFRHTVDPKIIATFTDNNTTDKANRYLNLPVPNVIKTAIDTPQGKSFADDSYPDSLYMGDISSDPKLPTIYQKQCANDQSSIVFYVSLADIITLNSNLSPSKTLLVKNGNDLNFQASPLNSKAKTDHIILENCYNNIISYNGKPLTVNGQSKLPRKVIGSSILSRFQAFPPKFAEGQNQFLTSFSVGTGVKISDPQFTQNQIPSKDISEGYRYGEFIIQDYNNPLNCQLNNPIVETDIFGRKIVGVDTALGCLPGSFEGVFTVILRISIGISAVILMFLIIINSLSLMNSNNNPEVIKKTVSNISRGVGALFIMLFAVVFLNFVGIKILDLNGLGSIGIGQIFGQ